MSLFDKVSPEKLSKLKEIHKEVLKNFKYKTDLEQYNVLEKWVTPDEDWAPSDGLVGDCEDFSLACRLLCNNEKYESRLVICLTELGEGHCVLEVNGYVMDNRQRKLVTKKKLEKRGYKWIAISDSKKVNDWHKVK